MSMLAGALLVVVSWLAMLTAAVGVGLLPSLLVSRGRWTRATVRMALWWGLTLLFILIGAVGIVLPLRDVIAGAVVVAVVAGLSLAGAIAARRALRSERRHAQGRRAAPALWWWVLLVGGVAGVAYLAVAALGPVTNYDSGLYHLGAIAYAGDYRAIPGLANLYFPLGYANAHFPLAAFLGNGPWDGVGYRLLNGLLVAAMVSDLLLRGSRRPRDVGFFILAVGTAATLVPLAALSDYWVTSPTSDSAVLVLTVVACAYLGDAVARPARAASSGSVAVMLGVLTVMLRPTMLIFTSACIILWLALLWRARKDRSPGLVPILVAAVAILAGVVMSVRDVILSGWIQYPLSLVAFDVPWLAADPTQFRVPTLGAARDASDLWAAAEGWAWVPGWTSRLPQQWEVFEFAALGAAALGLVIVAARVAAPLRGRALLLLMSPSLAAVIFWWVATPPSFRFIWGPLFMLVGIPAGWALWRLSSGRTGTWQPRAVWASALGVTVPVVAVVSFSAVARFDSNGLTEERTWTLGVSIPYAVAPVRPAQVTEVVLPSGLAVLIPTESDQCWSSYPLCTPAAGGSVRLRGQTIQDGFLP